MSDEPRGLDLELGDARHRLVALSVGRPHRYRERFPYPDGASGQARLVLSGGEAPEVELATITLPIPSPRTGADQLEVELTIFPDGTTLASLTDIDSRATGSGAFRLP